jgi:hypothetical protein
MRSGPSESDAPDCRSGEPFLPLVGPVRDEHRRPDGVADLRNAVIALPDILRDLHTDIFSLLWIVVGYTLVATVLVLNAGRLADMVGRARSYTLGFVIFTAASILCAPSRPTPTS